MSSCKIKLLVSALFAASMIFGAATEGYAQKADAQADLWQKAIEKGERAAQYNLGLASLVHFEGTKKEGAQWLRKIVNRKDGSFDYLYCTGMNFSHSKEFGEWLHKEADQGNGKGNARAQYCLGMTYVAANNNVEAIKWVRKAADQGYAGAEYLGVAYTEGNPIRGVERDPQEAVKWYRKAAVQGDAFAESRLGEDYYYGRGVSIDTQEAMKWWHKAAAQGDDYAQGMLKINER